jgi:hypothetical protein
MPCQGKAHKKYEFGVKVSVAVTNRCGRAADEQIRPGLRADAHDD